MKLTSPLIRLSWPGLPSAAAPRRLAFFILFAVLGTAPATIHAGDVAVVPNGGFEEDAQGWMWEQWKGKELPGKLDSADQKEGRTSFKMSTPGIADKRYLAKEIKVDAPGHDYLLSFWLKVQDVPDGAARVALAIPERGFFTGKDLVKTGGTGDWEKYEFPVPADKLGEAPKVTIFFYHDAPDSGSIGIDGLNFAPGAAATGGLTSAAKRGEATLTGDTSKPVTSTFTLGEKAELVFRAANLKPDSALELNLNIVDEHDKQVELLKLPVKPGKDGTWEGKVEAPAAKLGFYRVHAKLSNGVELSGIGSRKAGFLTYAVVPDPAQRVAYGETETIFGMQGGFGPWRDEVLEYLGARWVLDGNFEWRRNEPDQAGQYNAEAEIAKLGNAPEQASAWQKYTLPTLYAAPKWAVLPETLSYMTGSLTPEGEKAWDDYCRKAARVFMAKNPAREQRVYQITWEPIRPWGFKGTDQALARIHEIAHKALHETDPKAVVAGPTQGLKDLEKTLPLLKTDLPKFLDNFSFHPYFPIAAEREGMVPALRTLKKALAGSDGKVRLPIIGTEQGFSTEEDPAQDLLQAQGLLRQNLITLGEGCRMNMAYYIVDYRLSGQKGYGYYYNLVANIPWAPAKISPRPIAPAYAYQTLLLDGHTSSGAIEWLGETAWGYVFERGDKVVLAVWDYGDKPGPLLLPVGSDTARAYDWMGNELPARPAKGDLALTLGPEPVYVTGASSKLWGRRVSDLFALADAGEGITAYPGTSAMVKVTVRAPADQALTGTAVLTLDPRLAGAPVKMPVKLEAAASDTLEMAVNVPEGTAPGPYPLRLTLEDQAGAGLAVTGMNLQVDPPVSLVGMEPAMTPQGIGAVVKIRNARAHATSGSLEMELRYMKDTTRKLDFALEPGATGELTISYPPTAHISPTKIYQAKVTVTTSGGYVSSETALINFFGAQRFQQAPVIDAQPAEWQGRGRARLAGTDMVIREPGRYSGETDLSASLTYSWDETALYVLAEVSDEKFHQPYEGDNIWRGDSIQLAFNLDPRKKDKTTGNLLADVAERRRYSEITFALTKAGPEAFRHQSFDPENLPLRHLTAEEIRTAVKQADGRIVYEIAIPWAALGLPANQPRFLPGDFIGVAAAVNDCDGPEDEMPSALGLYGGIVPSKTPDHFGILLLRE